MQEKGKAEGIAAQRMQIVATLLSEGLDAAEARLLREKLCLEHGISERTLRRYVNAAKAEGFAGLLPKSKGRRKSEDVITPELLNEIIQLRLEVPSRSVRQIIRLLEMEEVIGLGEVKRSTLQRRLAERGYSQRHMKMYTEGGGGARRRFQMSRRNRLWHSDIKYGIYLPIGPKGQKLQAYLVVVFDDATRFVLHAEFYATLDKSIVERCLKQAIIKHGVPERVYFDNGKQYKTKEMTRICSKLGIKLIFAKPYSPEATGKVERFNRVVDSFLAEALIEKPETLLKLNELFRVWLVEWYQNKPHSALKDNMSPHAAYTNDKQPLKYAPVEELLNAFLHSEQRLVDKVGCISFKKKKYEVGLNFIGSKVTIVYDPEDTTELTVEYPNHKPWVSREIVIAERTLKTEKPAHPMPTKPTSSRILAAAAKANGQRKEQRATVIAYRHIESVGGDRV